jgi:hypothetical protein
MPILHLIRQRLPERLNDWSKNLNENLDTDVVYIDFVRAFDSVSVPKLIHKLSALVFVIR